VTIVNDMEFKGLQQVSDPRGTLLPLNKRSTEIHNKLIELGQHWRGLRYSSASGIVYGVERSMSKDKQLRNRVEEIKNHILYWQS